MKASADRSRVDDVFSRLAYSKWFVAQCLRFVSNSCNRQIFVTTLFAWLTTVANSVKMKKKTRRKF